MLSIRTEPLTSQAFAPFGEVLERPAAPGRAYYDDALGNLRPQVPASLSLSVRDPSDRLPMKVVAMERHEFSSQSFVPIDASDWLVVVAPHDAQGLPDLTRVQAFTARGDQGVTYRVNTWHHSMTVFDRPATFAVFMWRDGSSGDEEFVDVDPFIIEQGEG